MPRPLNRYELLGLAFALAWPVWSLGSAALNGRAAAWSSPYVIAPLAVVAGALAGRLLALVDRTARWPALVPVLLAVAMLPGSPVSLAPGPRPLGYPNANTAAALQVMALCAVLLLGRGRPRWERWLLGAGVAIAALAAVLHGSIAGIAVGLPLAGVIAVSLWRPVRRPARIAVVGFASWCAGGIAVVALAATDSWPRAVLGALSTVRQELWQLAWRLWRENPLAGAGPGAFREHNPYAVDADLAAAHSSLLQVGAELGTVGVLLLLATVGLGLRLTLHSSRPGIAVVAGAAWAALWIHSLADHLFDYPAVPVLAGLVLGWAGLRTTRRRPGSASRPGAGAETRPADDW